MAFNFQKNNNIIWDVNEELLIKADSKTPKLYKKEIIPTAIVKVVADEKFVGGYGTKQVDELSELDNHLLGKGEKFILDLGNHYVGNFSIDIASIGSPMDAPLYLKLRFAEIPAELEFNTDEYEGWLSKSWIQEEFVHLDVLPATLSLPRRYSCRYIEIEVIDSSPKWKAKFSTPVFRARTSANRENLKDLQVQDHTLKQIYDVSVKTLEDCMQLVYEDGPKRDRRMWIGDLRLQALANYSTFQDKDLVERSLYLFAGMRTDSGKIPANVFIAPSNTPDDTFLFEYSLNFTTILSEYYDEFKNINLIKELYSVSKDSIDLAITYIDDEGRFVEDESWPIFCDWSSNFDKTTAGQAMVIFTLKKFIRLAQVVNDSEIDKYQAVLDKMVVFSQSNLFDKDLSLFVVEKNNEINVASQVWMVIAGVMSCEENKLIMQTTIDKLFPISGIATPYMYHHINEALFIAGLKGEGEQFMKEYWGKMIKMGADTFWEAFAPEDPTYSPYNSPAINSYCHAWSCTPAYLIDKYILNN